VDGDSSLEDLNSLEALDRQVERLTFYPQELNRKNLSSLRNQVKRVEQKKDNGFSLRSFPSWKFCCQIDSRTFPVIGILWNLTRRFFAVAQNDRVKP
jgi:hypothetical protein